MKFLKEGVMEDTLSECVRKYMDKEYTSEEALKHQGDIHSLLYTYAYGWAIKVKNSITSGAKNSVPDFIPTEEGVKNLIENNYVYVIMNDEKELYDKLVDAYESGTSAIYDGVVYDILDYRYNEDKDEYVFLVGA